MRWSIALLVCFTCCDLSRGQNAAPAAPLELRLVAKRIKYPLSVPAKGDPAPRVPPAIVISAELKNTGKETLEILGPPGPELNIQGPGPKSIVPTTGSRFFVGMQSTATIKPGETWRVPLQRLEFHRGRDLVFLHWQEPGAYAVTGLWSLGVAPPPEGSERFTARPSPLLPDLKNAEFGKVVVRSPEIRLEVEAGDELSWWTEVLADADVDVRRAAARMLLDRGALAKASVAALGKSLGDADSQVRRHAVEALGAIGLPALPLEAKVRKALTDETPEVRSAAAAALVKIAAKLDSTGPALARLFADDVPAVRRAASAALGHQVHDNRTVDPAVIKTLRTVLRNEGDNVVKANVLETISSLPNPALLRDVIPFLKSENDAFRGYAIRAVGNMVVFMSPKDRAANDADGNPFQDSMAGLIYSLKDKAHSQGAAFALGQFRADGEPAVPALLDALSHPEHNKTDDTLYHPRVQLVIALREIGPGAAKAVPELARRVVEDGDWSVRLYAAQAIGAIGPVAQPAVPALKKALGDKMTQVQSAALEALAKLDALEALIQALDSNQADIRLGATMQLWMMKSRAKPAVPRLARLLKEDKVARNRARAAGALGEIGPEAGAAVADLVGALKDSEAEVRLAATEALGSLGPVAKEATPFLLELVKGQKEPKGRVVFLRTLYQIRIRGQVQAVPFLVELLREKDLDVLTYGVLLVRQLGPDAKAALPELERLAAQNTILGAEAHAAMQDIRK